MSKPELAIAAQKVSTLKWLPVNPVQGLAMERPMECKSFSKILLAALQLSIVMKP